VFAVGKPFKINENSVLTLCTLRIRGKILGGYFKIIIEFNNKIKAWEFYNELSFKLLKGGYCG